MGLVPANGLQYGDFFPSSERDQLRAEYRELWLKFVKVLNHAEILELELAGLKKLTFKVTTPSTLCYLSSINEEGRS